MSTLLLEGQCVVPARLAELGYTFRFATLESALKDLLSRADAATTLIATRPRYFG
jgi:NAD dependent epimerase/dehydratase family enzyme